ncbi:MAG: EamA family transporter [Boseongicola sp.]|nr:MAG: EamA family transporter [Boseongicola sp.]
MQPDITLKSWLSVATLGFVWGASFLFIELGLAAEMTPFWLAAHRILLAAILTTAFWQMRGGKLYLTDQRASHNTLFWIATMSTALPFMAITWGQLTVTAGFAGVSMAAVALIVLPLAHVLIPGEEMNRRKLLGFVIGFAGVVVLIGPDAFASTGLDGELIGRLACLFGASCYAISSITLRRLPPIDPIGLSAMTLIIGGAFSILLALFFEGLPGWPSRQALVVIVILGLVQTAMANLLRIVVVRSAGPTFMSLTNYQVPVWSVILGILILGEELNPSLFIAMTLILIGVALSQWNALRRIFNS